jgi:hypothetical protein
VKENTMKITRIADTTAENNNNKEETIAFRKEWDKKFVHYCKASIKKGIHQSRSEAIARINNIIRENELNVPLLDNPYKCVSVHYTAEDKEVQDHLAKMADKVLDKVRDLQGDVETSVSYPEIKRHDPAKTIQQNAEKLLACEYPEDVKTQMQVAYSEQDYKKVLDVACQHDASNRPRKIFDRDEPFIPPKPRKRRNTFTSDYLDLWEQARQEVLAEWQEPMRNNDEAVVLCEKARNYLSHDLTFENRSLAKDCLDQAVASLQNCPQVTPWTECNCEQCKYAREMRQLLGFVSQELTALNLEDTARAYEEDGIVTMELGLKDE